MGRASGRRLYGRAGDQGPGRRAWASASTRIGRLDGHFHYAQKKGYSGVGLYTRKAPSDVIVGFDGDEFDAEGRYVETRYDTAKRKFSVISCYFPSGSQRRRAPGGQVPLPRPHASRTWCG